MSRELFRIGIEQALQYFGLEVTSIVTKREPPPIYRDLKKVIRLNEIGIEAAYECPIDKYVTRNGFSPAETGWHPFVQACNKFSFGSGKQQFKGSFLEVFYKTWAPRNAKVAIAGFEDAPEKLATVASYTLHVPWMEHNPEERQELMARIILEENRLAGCPGLGAKEGYGLHGPVSEKKGEIELQRVVTIYRRIKANGYIRTHGDGDTAAIGIEYNGEFRFCVMRGQHRIAAAAALGYKTIPVKIIKVVHYAEIRHWPQVHRGYWSERQAQKYIEHLFSFDSKGWAKKMGLIH